MKTILIIECIGLVFTFGIFFMDKHIIPYLNENDSIRIWWRKHVVSDEDLEK